MNKAVIPVGKVRYYKRNPDFTIKYIDRPVEEISIDSDYQSFFSSIPHHTVLNSYLMEFQDADGTSRSLLFMQDQVNKNKTYFLPINSNVSKAIRENKFSSHFIGDDSLFKLELLF